MPTMRSLLAAPACGDGDVGLVRVACADDLRLGLAEVGDHQEVLAAVHLDEHCAARDVVSDGDVDLSRRDIVLDHVLGELHCNGARVLAARHELDVAVATDRPCTAAPR